MDARACPSASSGIGQAQGQACSGREARFGDIHAVAGLSEDEWRALGAVVLKRPGFVVDGRMPGCANDAPPGNIPAVVGHDGAHGAGGPRTYRGGDVAVGHDPTGRDRLDHLDNARDEVVRRSLHGSLEFERAEVLAVLGLANDLEAHAQEELFRAEVARLPESRDPVEATALGFGGEGENSKRSYALAL